MHVSLYRRSGPGRLRHWPGVALVNCHHRHGRYLHHQHQSPDPAPPRVWGFEGEVRKRWHSTQNARRSASSLFQWSTASDVLMEPIDLTPLIVHRPCLILKVARMKRDCGIAREPLAGGSLQIQTADLSQVHHDRLLQKVRKQLRATHGFPRSRSMGVSCVFSPETPRTPELQPDACHPDDRKYRDAVVPMAMEASRRSYHSAAAAALPCAPFKSTIHRHWPSR